MLALLTQECELDGETSLDADAVTLTWMRISVEGHCHRLLDMTAKKPEGKSLVSEMPEP